MRIFHSIQFIHRRNDSDILWSYWQGIHMSDYVMFSEDWAKWDRKPCDAAFVLMGALINCADIIFFVLRVLAHIVLGADDPG